MCPTFGPFFLFLMDDPETSTSEARSFVLLANSRRLAPRGLLAPLPEGTATRESSVGRSRRPQVRNVMTSCAPLFSRPDIHDLGSFDFGSFFSSEKTF